MIYDPKYKIKYAQNMNKINFFFCKNMIFIIERNIGTETIDTFRRLIYP